jgi:hypothetical protein
MSDVSPFTILTGTCPSNEEMFNAVSDQMKASLKRQSTHNHFVDQALTISRPTPCFSSVIEASAELDFCVRCSVYFM